MAAVPLLKAYGSRTKCSRYGVTAFPFRPAGVWSLSFYRCGHPGHHYCGSSPQAVPEIFQKHPPYNRFWFSVFPYYPSFLRSTLSIALKNIPIDPFLSARASSRVLLPYTRSTSSSVQVSPMASISSIKINIHFPFFHILPPVNICSFCAASNVLFASCSLLSAFLHLMRAIRF